MRPVDPPRGTRSLPPPLRLRQVRGVFLSNVPLDFNEGASGDDLLEVVVAEELLADFELIEELKPYREWCVPAELINRHGKVDLLSSEEEDEL